MVLFDKNRNMVIKTSILTNIPNVYRYRLRGGGETFVLGLKDDPERKYILSTDLEMLFEECVKNYGYLVETNLEQATTDEFPYIVIGEISEDIVLCDDGKFRLYGYSDENPFTLYDGSSEKLKDKLFGKNIVNVRNACTTRKGVLHNGEFFPDFKTFCKHIGVSHITLEDRIRSGKSLEEAVELKGRFRRRIEYKGKVYSSLSKLARAFGITPTSLENRLKKGMSLEEAINTPVKEKNKYLLDGKYVEYPEFKRYCQEHGTNGATILQYWSDKREETPDVRDIVKMFLEKKEKKTVTYHGKKYPTMTNALSELKIKESLPVIKKRMEKHGMSFEEVIEADPRMFKCGRIFQYKDKVYYSFKELCEGVNIPENTLRKRIKNGLSVEEAVEAPRNQIVKNRKNREVITYKGRTYKKWSEFFEENPLFKRAKGSIQNRRKRGMSIEEALEDYAKKYFVTDYKGNVYHNNKEMCLKYGLASSTVRKRLISGWSLEKALTTPTK